jgi:hypothetical protein
MGTVIAGSGDWNFPVHADDLVGAVNVRCLRIAITPNIRCATRARSIVDASRTLASNAIPARD